MNGGDVVSRNTGPGHTVDVFPYAGEDHNSSRAAVSFWRSTVAQGLTLVPISAHLSSLVRPTTQFAP